MVKVLTGKNGFCRKRVIPVAFDEARRLEALVVGLVLDAGEALRRGPVASQFVDAVQQPAPGGKLASRRALRRRCSLIFGYGGFFITIRDR